MSTRSRSGLTIQPEALDHTVSTRSLVTGVKCVRFDLQDTAGSGGNDGGGSDGGSDGDQGNNPLG